MSSNQKRKAQRAAELARRHPLQEAKVSAGPSPHTLSPGLAPQAPSGLATPPASSVAAPTHMVRDACYALIRRARSLPSWIWHDKSLIVTWIFRVLTLSSAGYLVVDRIYETDATVTTVASYPKNPFLFPFSINNNSHLFSIRNVIWKCVVVTAKDANNNSFLNDTSIFGTQSEIAAGGNLNITCNVLGGTSHIIRTSAPIVQATLRIELSYQSNLFGFYYWNCHPRPTEFTWMSDASNPQWVRGEFAK